MAAYEDKLREGRYANHFKVGQNAFEFIIDFGQFYPENGKEQFHSRIVTSPHYAKALSEILQDSIASHEKRFGKIRDESE